MRSAFVASAYFFFFFFNKCKANTSLLTRTSTSRIFTSHLFLSPFLYILLPSARLCTSAKVISSINSYHQPFNWSITPAPHLLNASLINYCPPWGWEWEGCQHEFSRLRWIFIVFVPWSVRAPTCFETHCEDKIARVLLLTTTDVDCGLHRMTLAAPITNSSLFFFQTVILNRLAVSNKFVNPVSQILDHLQWDFDMVYFWASWSNQGARLRQQKIKTRRGFKVSSFLAFLVLKSSHSFCFENKKLQLKILSEFVVWELYQFWCLFVLAGKCLIDMSTSTY